MREMLDAYKHLVPRRLKQLIRGTNWWKDREYRYESSLTPGQYRHALESWYMERMGRPVDLDNPVSLTEKIQWLKLWDSTEIKGTLADKWQMRKWVADEVGKDHLPQLVVDESWDDPRKIDMSQLKRPCVLKLNTGSGTNLFIRDNLPSQREVVKFFKHPMSVDYAFKGGFELHYSYIRPRLFAEEFLESAAELVDYRFFCSWGEIFSIWVDTGSWNHQYHRSVFTPEWEYRDIRSTHPKHEIPPTKPVLAEDMVSLAKELSANFSLVRIDLYEYKNRVLVGELTFTPQSGQMVFDDPDFDRELGSHVRLPETKSEFKGYLL